MRNYSMLAVLFCMQLAAQPNTEIYLLNMQIIDGKVKLSSPENISNNSGYDNQPSFSADYTLLYSATRNGQTDILRYDIRNQSRDWLTDTPEGSEYSPLNIPGSNAISAIRLDKDGRQLLYHYDLVSGKSNILLSALKVGYHLWYSRDIIVAAVLTDSRMDLVVSNIQDNTTHTFQKDVGRSLHKIPDTGLISYISKESETWELKSLDPVSGTTAKITDMVPGVEDVFWLNKNVLLAGNNNNLLTFNIKTDSEWRSLAEFDNLDNITRIATNDSRTKLALVSEILPGRIVEKQLKAYNSRDIDKFLAIYDDNVELYSFPNTLILTGKTKLREKYELFFNSTADLKCEVKNRIILGNKVIDEEYLTMNGSTRSAVAIYELAGDKIVRVTFMK
jgi:hypothetical protein